MYTHEYKTLDILFMLKLLSRIYAIILFHCNRLQNWSDDEHLWAYNLVRTHIKSEYVFKVMDTIPLNSIYIRNTILNYYNS